MWNEKPCVYLRLSALLQGIMKEVEIGTLEPFSTWKNSIKMPRRERKIFYALLILYPSGIQNRLLATFFITRCNELLQDSSHPLHPEECSKEDFEDISEIKLWTLQLCQIVFYVLYNNIEEVFRAIKYVRDPNTFPL